MRNQRLASDRRGRRRPAFRSAARILPTRAGSNLDMMTAVLRALVEKYGLAKTSGSATSRSARSSNTSREIGTSRVESTLSSGLAAETPALDVQRACGTSLSAAILIGSKISAGIIDAGIAGGTDSISDLPDRVSRGLSGVALESARGRKLADRVRPWLKLRPRHFKPVLPGRHRAPYQAIDGREHGAHGEGMAHLSRRAGSSSRSRAIRTRPRHTPKVFTRISSSSFKACAATTTSEPIRRSSSSRSSKPVFDRGSGGHADGGQQHSADRRRVRRAALLGAMGEGTLIADHRVHDVRARSRSRLRARRGAADGAGVCGVGRMLAEANLALQDFDFYEIHEAFAAQTLATLKAWESDGVLPHALR